MVYIDHLDSHDWVQIIGSFLGAFFAFVFFIVSENLLDKRRTRRAVLDELFATKYYLANLLYFFEMNILSHHSITKDLRHDSITIQRLNLLPLRDTSWHVLKHLKVSLSIEKFLVHLKVINQEIDTYNKILDTYSRFAEISTIENRKMEFEQSMTQNVNQFKANKAFLVDSFSRNKENLASVIDEVDFYICYMQSFFVKRIYYRVRMKLDPSYQERLIQLVNHKKGSSAPEGIVSSSN